MQEGPGKTNKVLQSLRGRIVSAKLPAGARLPTRKELEERFHAGPHTIQRALDLLKAQGFVEARGTRGTFVVEYPPHLYEYAVAFPYGVRHDDAGAARFWSALRSEAAFSEQWTPKRLVILDNINGTENDSLRDLTARVSDGRIAGVIFVAVPEGVAGGPLIRKPSVPTVAVWDAPADVRIPTVRLDLKAFMSKALAYLAEHGRKRIAVIGVSPEDKRSFYGDVMRMAARRKLRTEPYWIHLMHPDDGDCAQSCTHLLMRAPRAERPDGLIITDDNLVPFATSGLEAAGARGGVDADVVAHANFPWATDTVTPVARLGFDAREVLRVCVDAIDRQRHGRTAARRTQISPRWEHEVK